MWVGHDGHALQTRTSIPTLSPGGSLAGSGGLVGCLFEVSEMPNKTSTRSRGDPQTPRGTILTQPAPELVQFGLVKPGTLYQCTIACYGWEWQKLTRSGLNGVSERDF